MFFREDLLNFVSWQNYRTLELIFHGGTAAGIVFLIYQFFQQRVVDRSGVSVGVKSGYEGQIGILSVTNNSDVPLDIRIDKRILNDGKTRDFAPRQPETFYPVFKGVITPKQSIDFHAFGLEKERTWVFLGLIRITIANRNALDLTVRYAGDLAKNDPELRDSTNPHGYFVIASQERVKLSKKASGFRV